ncbi:MAG: AMP-binding protein [Lachnospiraceae bacterium]|nr:AMP-binding protein [Lachnospiraceae bacterium]
MLTNYRDFMDEQIRKYPTVPMYAYRDRVTKQRVEVLPAQFKESALRLAAYLLKEGYEHKHVGIFSPNSYHFILARQALLCCGCTVVMLDIRMETAELKGLVEDSDCCAIFCAEESRERAEEIAKDCGVSLLYMSRIDEYMKIGGECRAEGKCMAEEVEIDPDALAFLFYTSGTTGRNKGVMLSQRNYIFPKIMEYEQETWATGDNILVLPFTHVMSETAHLNAMFSGHTLYINQNIRHLFDEMLEEKPEIMVLVPLFVQAFMDQLWKTIRDEGREEEVRKQIEENSKNESLTLDDKREMFAHELSIFGGRLYKLISGGAPIAPRLIREFQDFGIDVLCGYGSSECAGVISVNLYGHNRVGSSGFTLKNTEIRIDHPDKNGIGEICIKGDHVMMGYYKKPKETEEVLRDGWVHSGDCGYFDEDHYLYVTGRIKNLIILSNGENVSPEEIERRIARNPAVKEVQVYAEDESIVAEIYPDYDYFKAFKIENGEETLRQYVLDLNEELADYKRIHQIRIRKDPFEKTSTGKIKRK